MVKSEPGKECDMCVLSVGQCLLGRIKEGICVVAAWNGLLRVHAGKEEGCLYELAVVSVMGDWPHLKGIYPINDVLRKTRVICPLPEKGVINLEMKKTKMSPESSGYNCQYQCVLIFQCM